MITAAKFPDTAYLVTKTIVSLYEGLTSDLLIGTWPAGRIGRTMVTVSSVTDHTDCAGTVTLGTETLTFIQAGTKQTTINLTAKPTASSSNLDCHLHIDVIDSNGAPIYTETLTAIDIFFQDETEYYSQQIGGFVKRPAQASTEDTSCVVGDIIRYNSIDYTIRAIHVKKDRLGLERFRILQF